MLKLSNISYSYQKKNACLKEISFQLHKGEILGITGSSGCGKSTLCHLILGLLKPLSGQILFKNEEILKLKNEKRLHKKIQLVMQNPETAFNPNKTLYYSLMETRHFMHQDKTIVKENIRNLLDKVGLENNMMKRIPEELSGGQLQRFAILRSLLMQPELLILDEVTSMLDTLVQAKIIHLLRNLKQDLNLSYMMVSHDIELLKQVTNRTIILEQGFIKEITEYKKLEVL